MTSERVINAVAMFLRSKVVAEGGSLSVSETVSHTLSLLSGSPGRFRVIVQWQREASTNNRGERVLTMLVIVQQGGQNLAINPGDAITVQRPAALAQTTADASTPTVDNATASLNNAPLMQRTTQVFNWARSIRFLNADIRQQWPQMQPGAGYWLNDASLPTRQIALEFSVTFTSEAVTTEEVTA